MTYVLGMLINEYWSSNCPNSQNLLNGTSLFERSRRHALFSFVKQSCQICIPFFIFLFTFLCISYHNHRLFFISVIPVFKCWDHLMQNVRPSQQQNTFSIFWRLINFIPPWTPLIELISMASVLLSLEQHIIALFHRCLLFNPCDLTFSKNKLLRSCVLRCQPCWSFWKLWLTKQPQQLSRQCLLSLEDKRTSWQESLGNV